MRPPRRQGYLDAFHAEALRGRLPSGPLLEIACGGGGLSRRLAAAGLSTVAIDLDPPAADASGLARMVRADAARLPLRSGAFRAALMVHAFDTLERAGQLEAALREAERILAPGGALLAVENRGRRTSRLPLGALAEAAGFAAEGSVRLRGRKGALHALVSIGAVPRGLFPALARCEQAFARLRHSAPGAYLFLLRKKTVSDRLRPGS